MKIAVVFTGGTIGSKVKGGLADLDQSAHFALLKPFSSDPDLDFFAFNPYSVLSENLSAVEINLLQNEIEKILSEDFDGIIVTHGTDTIQYAASAAEIAFFDSGIPIVFVSANFPLEHPKTNGFVGFKAALEWIKQKKKSGVFVSYQNGGEGSTKIHFPSRLLQYRESDSALFSLGDLPLASYENKFSFHQGSSLQKNPIGKVEYCADSQILPIEMRPGNGFSYSLEGVKAILLSPYHSFTLPTANPAFQSFCKRAKNEKIPIFMAGNSSEIFYASTALYEELGIKPFFGAYPWIYMKIWAAISLGKHPGAFLKEKAE